MSRQPSISSRDDLWSEDETSTLVEAWGHRYVDLNRGNLRQDHWREIADAVNGSHENLSGVQPHRTGVQCKNRIDTLKKKYKIERARVSESNGIYKSPWPFFSTLHDLLNPTNPASSTPDPSPDAAEQRVRTPPPMLITPFPVAPRSAISRRPAASFPLPFVSSNVSNGFHGNLTAFATAAAAAAASEEAESKSSRKKRRRREESYGELAEAIDKLSQIYERVEERKRKDTVELEKQRMKFAKDLECHRMRLFTEMQVKVLKINCADQSKGSFVAAELAAGALIAGETLFPVFIPPGN